MSPQAANEMVKAMEERGFITREPHPTHGRILHITLTARGAVLLSRCSTAADKVEADLLKELCPEERDELQRLLRACFSALASDLMER